MDDRDETPDWYGEAFTEFLRRTNQVEEAVEYFKNHSKELGLSDTVSCLSIGPAQGLIDSRILKDAMPICREYFAVEPDLYNVNGLKKSLRDNCPHIKSDVFHGYVQDWSGQTERFDTILLFHVLYYLEDRQTFLHQCMSDWLKPGGRIIILHGAKNSFSEVSKAFREQKNEEGHGYFQQHIQKDLDQLKFTHKVDTFKIDLDVSEVNTQLTNFYLMKPCSSEAEVSRVSDILSALYPSGTEDLDEFVTIVPKQ